MAGNVVRAIFQLENIRDAEGVVQIVELLIKWLYSPEQEALLGYFAIWIKAVLSPMWTSKAELETWQSLNNLHEVHTMLSERAKKWPEEMRQKGHEEGLKEGRRVGQAEGRMEGRAEGRAEGRLEGHREGVAEGMEKRSIEVALTMIIETDMSNACIAKLSCLDVSHISELRARVESQIR